MKAGCTEKIVFMLEIVGLLLLLVGVARWADVGVTHVASPSTGQKSQSSSPTATATVPPPAKRNVAGLPTPNATLNAELEKKWGQKISEGPHSCTAEDQKAIMQFPYGHGDSSWGQVVADCGHAGLNVIFGINQDKVNACLAQKVTITPKCSSCYAKMAEYDFNNCKVQCLFNWCSEGCITCNHGSNVIGCIGFVDPQPTYCTTQVAALVEHAQTSPISFIAVALSSLFMGCGVVFAVLHFRRRDALTMQEPLMEPYTIMS